MGKTMTLREYLRLLDVLGKWEFAKRCGCSLGTLYKIAGMHRQAGPGLANRIVAASNNVVARSCLRFAEPSHAGVATLPPPLRGRKKAAAASKLSYTHPDKVHESEGEVA